MENFTIFDTKAKMQQVLNENKTIGVAISGGADSDLLVDLFEKNKLEKNIIKYIFFDTGLEYEATKRHLLYLENKYNIEIERVRPKVPIPLAVKKEGVPFKSKQTSVFIDRLQSKNFDWNDIELGYEECYKKYPNSKSALQWLFGENIMINCSRYLRNYLYENGLDIKISDRCYYFAKKKTAKEYQSKNKDIECWVVGVRKAEGGYRSVIKNCYFTNGKMKNYYPILHWTDEDKKEYIEENNIKHSDCYEVWGMDRTGCAGCPFGRESQEELAIIEKYEPKLLIAVKKLFEEAYVLEENVKQYRKTHKKSDYKIK